MPSTAYDDFKSRLLKDVDELINAHTNQKTGKQGKQNLGHFTRSALFILCASWEFYIESVCTELFPKIVLNNSVESIHKDIMKVLANYVKNQKDDLYCIKLIGEGWKECFQTCLNSEISGFNTPKSEPVKALFKKFLNIDLSTILDDKTSKDIDEFVKKRGEIAHKGAKAYYPTIDEVIKYRNKICKIIMDIDEFLADKAKPITGKKAWQKLTDAAKIKDIKLNFE